MGLLDKLITDGSPLSVGNGATPAVNPLATYTSKMHDYSISGADFATVNAEYQAYNDGVLNLLPTPSVLDLDGLTPPKYTDALPG